jgi:hypothetical protein
MEHCFKLFIEYYNIYFYKSGLLQYIVPIKYQFNHLEYCPNNPPSPFSVFRQFSSQNRSGFINFVLLAYLKCSRVIRLIFFLENSYQSNTYKCRSIKIIYHILY